MDRLSMAYNDHTLFHMLRHFECIHPAALACLHQRGYRPMAIHAALQLPGSRFLGSFAQDLYQLEQQLEHGMKQMGVLQNGYQHWHFQFDKNSYPDGIGKLGVVPLHQLQALGASNLVQLANRGSVFNHAGISQLPISWELTVVLKPQRNYHLLVTAFPGPASMPLPKQHLDTAFNQQCQDYWKNHAFLVLNP